MAARGQPHRGQAVAGDDRHLLLVEFDLLRPGVGVTGQRKPGWGEGPDDQFEAPALVVNCEAQGCRPERESRLGIVVGRRAADVGDAVQHPLLPALEGRGQGRQILGRANLGPDEGQRHQGRHQSLVHHGSRALEKTVPVDRGPIVASRPAVFHSAVIEAVRATCRETWPAAQVVTSGDTPWRFSQSS